MRDRTPIGSRRSAAVVGAVCADWPMVIDTDVVHMTVRMVEVEDVFRLAKIEAAADELLIERFGVELFSDVTAGQERVADPGFVLVAGRPCIGFAQVLEVGATAHLQQVAVDPDHGRRGVGTTLVEACCEEVMRRGYGELTLTTFRDISFNAPWYERLGFQIIKSPVGVVARHMKEERPYAQLSPRVAMIRRLGAQGAPRPENPVADR